MTALVANRGFDLLDVQVTPGQPIPAALWARTPERNRTAMVNSKFVVRPDEYAGPAYEATSTPRTKRGRKT